MPDTKERELVSEVLAEVNRVSNSKRSKGFPTILWLGDGNGIYSSKKVSNHIRSYCRSKLNTTPALKSQFTDKDFHEIVEHAFANAITASNIADSSPENAGTVLGDIELRIANALEVVAGRDGLEYCFGCTLVREEDVPPFEIGPVTFEPRSLWLERKASEARSVRVCGGRVENLNSGNFPGQISQVTKRRILNTWSGKAVRKRKRSRCSFDEEDIIKAIGACPYVCTVKLPGVGGNSGQAKALFAARIALTSISLMWQKPSKALEGLNLLYDRENRTKVPLRVASNGLILGGRESTCTPYATRINDIDFRSVFKDFQQEHLATGDAIRWWIAPDNGCANPRILSVLSQALFWFHEACREESDLKAIMGFASCIEVLSDGGTRAERYQLIEMRAGYHRDLELLNDGTTVEDLVKRIFEAARNRLLHGPTAKNGASSWNAEFVHDWSSIRSHAEFLSRACLLGCLEWASNNPSNDVPKSLRE
ncbi:hypothetical protein [Leisingera sp. NJS204]|uniref:hypothetical protein n=1 Tax=Leisingera sp. NJS204 TaxID=2508307 RepID=UPI001012097F|nr:hypothetical protein [Leisingera sp. NJS204]QAX29200.1 hypothetical protein ETW24_07430 [Leisingera sp. NJS204]